MSNRRLWISLIVFLMLGYFYYVAYVPVYFSNGIKVFNTQYTQGDVNTYLDFAKREIEQQPFFAWFLKLNFNNASLVYFSWFNSVLYKISSHEMILSFAIVAGLFAIVREILKVFKQDSFYSSFAMLTSFSMLIHMQTYTKELLALLCLLVALLGVSKKINKLVVLGVFALAILRVYFALIFICAFIFYLIYVKYNKKILAYMILSFGVFLPFLFTKVFPHFSSPQSIHSEFGISSYYLISIKYPGLFLLWLPFRVLQNLAEPFWAIYSTPVADLIFRVPVILDTLTSTAMLICMGIVWSLRDKFKKASSFVLFLFIFILVYLGAIASVPIVHFRYVVTLLPIMGLLADLLRPIQNKEFIGQR